MESYNLLSPVGDHPLRYPHYTKWRNGVVHIVTSPDKKIKVGDEIFVANETNMGGEFEYSHFITPVKVKSILEERSARGQHKTKFKPIFQKVSV